MDNRSFESGAAASPPAAPASPSVGHPTAGDPQAAVPATKPGPYWFYQIGEEMRAVLVAAGITPSTANNAQLLEAIQRLIDAQSGNYALDTGSANAYVVALSPAITAYTDGMTVRMKIVNANTGASTLNAGGGAVALVNDVGGALVAGDAPAGGIVTATYVASANKFYITSMVSSQWLSSIPGVNKLRNAGMRVNQKRSLVGTPVSLSTTNAFVLDRWAVGLGTAPSGTLSAYQVAGDGTTKNALRYIKSSGTWAGNVYCVQTIPTADCYDMAGKIVSFSLRSRKGSSFDGTVSASVVTGTGTDQGVNGATGGSWSGYAPAIIIATVANASINTSFTTISGTVAIPAGATEAAIIFFVTDTATAGDANHYLDFTDCLFEVSPIPTTYRPIKFEDDLLECKRWLQKSYPHDTAIGASSLGGSITIVPDIVSTCGGFPFPVEMAGTPTVAIYPPRGGAAGKIETISAGTQNTNTASASNINSAGVYNIAESGTGFALTNTYSLNYVANAEGL